MRRSPPPCEQRDWPSSTRRPGFDWPLSLADLAASRQRIVEQGGAGRRRLEHDLHDGARQRLIALQVLLEI
jgi:signal transduction histidine kinase